MNQTVTDSELWDDFRKGENYALSHIYYSYIDRLYQYCRKFSNDNELVKDIIQELFFDLIRTRKNLGSTDNIYFYLIKALRRRITNTKTGNKKMVSYDEAVEMPAAGIVYSIEDEFIQKEELTIKEERILSALSGLSSRQREILYYRFTCNFEYDQICEIMSIKYDSARKMVFRAIKTLREQLTDTTILLFFLQHKYSVNFKN
jgi:RNA polymerase sigma factor (sigma-70 family)